MGHITIVVPQGAVGLSTVACVAGAYEILLSANAWSKRNGRSAQHTLVIAGSSDRVAAGAGLFTVAPQCSIAAIRKTSLIIIPSVSPGAATLQENEALIEWVRGQYGRGAEVASMCSGAFLLAASGLLDGRSCSTHWSQAQAFRAQFPLVHLHADQLITDEADNATREV
ncbi:MAG: AraC family transcriptional regulator, partial [Sphingobacteriales bacterium]